MRTRTQVSATDAESPKDEQVEVSEEGEWGLSWASWEGEELLQLDVGSGAKVLKSVRHINSCPGQLGQTDNILQWTSRQRAERRAERREGRGCTWHVLHAAPAPAAAAALPALLPSPPATNSRGRLKLLVASG